MKGTDVMINLSKTVINNGPSSDYVLFIIWFSCLAQLLAVKELGLNTIAIIKKIKKIFIYFNTKIYQSMVFTRYLMIALDQPKSEDK